MTARTTTRRAALAVAIALSAAGLWTAPASADLPSAATTTSTGSGDWADSATWLGPMGSFVPGPSEVATIDTGHTVTLSADMSVGGLTIGEDATVDLNGHTLTVGESSLALSGTAGHAATVRSTGGRGKLAPRCLTTATAVLDHVAVELVDAQYCAKPITFGPGGTTWTASAAYSQTGGLATIRSAMTGVSPVFDGVYLTVSPGAAIDGRLKLSGDGPVTFAPTQAHAGAADPAVLTVGDLEATGTHVLRVDWNGLPTPIATGARVNLLRSSAGPLTGLSATSEFQTTYGSDDGGAQLRAEYGDLAPVNTGEAPSLRSSNATDASRARPGDQLTCSPGDWSSATDFTFQWRRGSVIIADTTGFEYTAGYADVGQNVSCTPTAVNGSRSTVAAATAGIPVHGVPLNTVPPTVTSSNANPKAATTGDVLSCSTGTWNDPGSTAYAWRRAGVPLSGATDSTYAVVAADLGHELTCVVTHMAFGGTMAASSLGLPALAAPWLTFTGPADDLLTAAAARVDYALSDGARVTACAVDGKPHADCSDAGLQLAGLVDGQVVAVAVTIASPAGVLRQFERTFRASIAAVPAPPVDVGRAMSPKDPPTGSWAPVVLAAGQTVARDFTGAGDPAPDYVWDGGGAVVGWKAGAARGVWTASITAPGKPGTYRVVLRAKADGAAIGSFVVYAFDPATVVGGTGQFGGVAAAKAALVCPQGPDGTAYGWIVNGAAPSVPVTGHVLPAAQVPASGTVWCVARDGRTGVVSRSQVLIDRSTRFAALVAGGKLSVATSGASLVEIVASAKGKFGKQRLQVKLRPGKNAVRLDGRLPTAGYRVTLRPLHVRGKKVTKGPLLVLK